MNQILIKLSFARDLVDVIFLPRYRYADGDSRTCQFCYVSSKSLPGFR
jgi:hypothetical protein